MEINTLSKELCELSDELCLKFAADFQIDNDLSHSILGEYTNEVIDFLERKIREERPEMGERVIAISEKRLQEMKQQFIDEAWKDESADAESIQAYLEDFTEQIIKGGLSNE